MPVECTIWIMPPANLRRNFAGIISHLSKEYKSPKFQPHVTLLAVTGFDEKEAVKKTKEVLKGMKPFEVRLEKVGYSDKFFQCLFIRARKTKALMSANKKARKIFGVKNDYTPHLSLMYGNLPVSVKKKIVSEIGNQFNSKFMAKEFWLIRGESPDTKDWHVAKKFRI